VPGLIDPRLRKSFGKFKGLNISPDLDLCDPHGDTQLTNSTTGPMDVPAFFRNIRRSTKTAPAWMAGAVIVR